jgi:hypothetical protein
MEKYLIGDKIRFTASIVKLGSVEPDIPDVVTISVYQADGTILLNKANASLTNTPGNYYYDWVIESLSETIPLIKNSQLIVLWDWSGSQKKKMNFTVEPVV